ncbi:MAG: serine/threonine protein kinase [Proteobacteria bacterium]|nr:serine/threonine protein kinase [Pseudomonadota bacterium]
MRPGVNATLVNTSREVALGMRQDSNASSGVRQIAQVDDELSGRTLGAYEIMGRLASGGMASVYLGRRRGARGFERLFAVKVLHRHLERHPDAVRWFLNEARVAAQIRHPNVVSAVDVSDRSQAGCYMVMDYVPGDHLFNLLRAAGRRGRRIRVSDALRVISDVLAGLAAAHRVQDEFGRPFGLVHRDLSPHNVMLGEDGIARITDFGVAQISGPAAAVRVRLVARRQPTAGKLAYMSPEQALGSRLDQRSDLFTVGILLWESLVGKRLFAARDRRSVVRRLCRSAVPAPSRFYPELAPYDALTLRALSRSPAMRFQNADDFAQALELVAEQGAGLASQRVLGRLVRGLAAEKLDSERALLRYGSQRSDAGTGLRRRRDRSQPTAPRQDQALVLPPPPPRGAFSA